MRSQRVNNLCLWWRAGFLLFLIFVERCYGLNIDGVLLLAFKYSIIKDPTNVLESWNYDNDTPCSWKGVSCGSHPNTNSRVIGLALPSSQLLGSIPADFGMIEHLQNLDLSDNSLNGSLPFALFNATELRFLDLSNNLISGEVPETIGRLQNLQSLNLSDNALAGKIPATLTTVSNLTVVSLKNNYLSGDLPSRFSSLQVLDLSCNLINGSLPSDFGGPNLRYLNVSNNKLSGNIPPQFAEKIPGKATVDLSFNNLTGEIPESSVFMNQETKSFSGNLYLCGPPTKNLCPIPSTPSAPPNVSAPTSPPAFAAIPKTVDSSTSGNSSESQRSGLRPVTIIGIVIGDLTGTAILALIFCYLYHVKKKKKVEIATKDDSWSTSTSESRSFTRWSCLRKKAGDEKETGTSSSDSDNDHQNGPNRVESQRLQDPDQNKKGRLVTVDGEKELELETLLRASAYILGATGSSIMYKAVLEDGTSLAVRRIGENSVDRFKGFETQVRVIAKLVHPNLVHIRGFYWGVDEKLIIYDFVPNGSLANARHRKVGSSPCHLRWETRLRIAKGVARGLAFLHEKKHVHGNLKPSNILLGSDMEPKIGDFGLEKLVTGDSSYKAGGSSRIFGSKRSTASRDSFQDFPMGPSPSPSPNSSSVGFGSPYHAPESLRNLKPNPKWDVYSFGVMLLELLTGKVIVVDEMGQVNGLVVEDKNRALRMADAAIRAELEGKEELLLGCFKLGYGCASPIPQKRPTMKEAIQILDKIPSSISSPHFYGHL
ncbi:probable LRR receptor-like serine/threonine-protein kinase At4g37250 [Tripterygium wilfordii]|uniref:probable LRR receptor-like serine/threonine-protein kinase At4g37250 n=1 Tax=Tripterygium wilfordii TaxID=458696 RepID=UPI0018F7F1C8|nr:probable LRR receptor-like serine/threonine-protein kinase At4g37250 [Tripterygium wilfordii]